MKKVKEKLEKEKIEKLNASEFCKDLNAVMKKHKIKTFYMDGRTADVSTHWWLDTGKCACRLQYDYEMEGFTHAPATNWRRVK